MPIELKPWWDLLMEGTIAKVKLVPNELSHDKIRADYMPRRSFNVKGKRRQKTVHEYYDEPIDEFTVIDRDTLFHYPPNDRGGYGLWPHIPGDPGVAGIFLKQVISKEIQAEAYRCLHAIPWHRKPQRGETRPAMARQEGQQYPAREEGLGNSGKGTPQSTLLTRKPELTAALEPLFKRIEEIFATVFPEYWKMQNTPTSTARAEAKKRLYGGREGYSPGGAPSRFRLFDTCFTSAALLRSCPSAVHMDGNSKAALPNFPCLTSIGNPDAPFSGGKFCLLEYRTIIPVTPGDILIHQTTKDWHTNIGPVEGEKFSLVLYYQTRLAMLKRIRGLKQGTIPRETDETAKRDILLDKGLDKRGTPEPTVFRLKKP